MKRLNLTKVANEFFGKSTTEKRNPRSKVDKQRGQKRPKKNKSRYNEEY